MIPIWAIKAGAVVALLAGVWFHGRSSGADRVQAKWDQQVREDKDAADAARESDRLRARTLDAEYQANRAAAARRLADPSPESVYALKATICPPPGALGKPLELGDVPIPGVWLERLRSAGANY